MTLNGLILTVDTSDEAHIGTIDFKLNAVDPTGTITASVELELILDQLSCY